MLSCKEVSSLVTESLDRELPFRKRTSMRLHLLMCSLCSRFRRQMLFLRDAARSFAAASEKDKLPANAWLSPEARARIKRALEQNGQ